MATMARTLKRQQSGKAQAAAGPPAATPAPRAAAKASPPPARRRRRRFAGQTAAADADVAELGWYYVQFPERGLVTAAVRPNGPQQLERAPDAPLLQKRAFVLVLTGWPLAAEAWADGDDVSESATEHATASGAVRVLRLAAGNETLALTFTAQTASG